MADVLIVCVREDESQAKSLADMFERAGFTVGGAPSNDGALRGCGATVVLWSQAAIRSRPFLDASQRAVNAGKAVLACMIDPPPGDSVGHSPAFDIGDWDGDPEDPNLDPLFFAVDRMVGAARADAGYDAPAPARQERAPRERSRATPTPAPTPTYARAPYEAPRQAARPEPRELPRAPIPASARAPAPARPAPAYDAPRPDPLGSEAEYWRSIRHSREPADFHDYLSKYGQDGAFAELAEIKLKELQGGRAPARETPAPAPRRQTQSYDAAPRAREPSREPARAAERISDQLQGRERATPRAFEREREPERVRSGGGLGGVLFAVVLLGGVALAGGLYFGMQQQGPTQAAENNQSAAQTAPAPSADESVSYEEAALDPPPQVDSAHDAPRGGPDLPRTPAPRQVAAASTPAAPARAAQQARDVNAAATSGPVAAVPLTPAPAPVVFVEPMPVATVAPTPAAAPRPTGRVSWAAQPSAARIAALYPTRALRTGQNGSARLDCAVRTDFGLSCTIAQETPQGVGFGQAALRAAASFRANPNLSNGDSSSGARTSLTIRFQGG